MAANAIPHGRQALIIIGGFVEKIHEFSLQGGRILSIKKQYTSKTIRLVKF